MSLASWITSNFNVSRELAEAFALDQQRRIDTRDPKTVAEFRRYREICREYGQDDHTLDWVDTPAEVA